MKSRYVMMVAVLLTIAFLGALSTMAQEPKIVARDAVAYGKTYAEWAVAWNQWGVGLPVANHPLFDNGDCSVGQSGPVWFLGGKYCSLFNTNCGYTGVVRECKVPAGRALFVTVLDAEVSSLETGVPLITDLKQLAESYVDPATVSMEVDGVPIRGLKERFRVQADAFAFTIPTDNQFTAIGEGQFAAGTYFPGVDDGIYVMLYPLPPGKHTVHFHGYFPAFNFNLDITYHLRVEK